MCESMRIRAISRSATMPVGGDGAEGEGGEAEAGVHDHEAHAH